MRRHRKSFSEVPKPLRIFFFIGFVIIAVYALGNLLVFLWNHTVAEVFSWKPITFWQALGMFLLARIFFGRFGGHRRHWKQKKQKWKKRWRSMSEDDRVEMKAKWKEYCNKR